MKRILLFFSITILFSVNGYSQGSNCSSATPFCGNVTFPNNTSTVAQAGPAYGCLGSQPNPAWFFIKSTAAGTMTFTISQANTVGNPIDVDFIAWGPFSTTTGICNNLTGSCSGDHACNGNIEDCSFNPAAVESMSLTATAAGQYFMILITNFSGQAGNITFNQTGGPPTDCSITCPSVNSGPGFQLSDGSSMPATVACNAPNFALYASSNTPFGNPIVPGVMISFTSNANSTLQVNWSQNGVYQGCFGPAPCAGGIIPTNTDMDMQISFMSPSLSQQIQFCETSTAGANIPYTITDEASGVVLNSGTWVTDALCTTITIPPGTISGVSTWSVTSVPAGTPCPGCLSSTDWGATVFNPGAAAAAGGSGTWNICYSFDPPGTCPTYNYCQSITVTNPNNAAWTTPAAMCASAASINLNPLVTGTAGGTWSGTGVTGSTFNPAGLSGSIPVTYTVGSGGCSASVTHNITVNPVPTVSITPATASICAGQSVTLTANPSIAGGTYSWAPGGATTAAITVSPATSTTYTVTYTKSGCIGTATRLVTVNPVPTVAVNNATICSGTSASLTATPSIGGGTYSWSSGAGSTQTVSVSPGSTTTYTVTYTLSGCSNTGSGTVTVNPMPTVSISPATSTICSGQSATLTATPSIGGGTYSWAPGGATTAAITVSPATSTTYTVTYTLSGCSTTATRLITVNPTPTVSVNTPAAVCAGQSASLTATPSIGGGTYSWAPGGGTTQTISVAPGSTTTYTVTYSLSGCSNTGTGVVTIKPVPTVSISPATSTICAGSSATLTATPSLGGGTYSWAPGGATTSAITVSPATSTTYTVVYSLSGCTGTDNRLITVNPVPTVSVNSPAAVCSGQTVTLTATPSTGGGTYSWAPSGGSTQSINVSPATTTTYTVTYTLTGCSNTGTGTVTINPVPTVTISPASSTICAGSSATLTATPSIGGGTYSWAPGGATTAAITVSPASSTTYTVTYTLSGCIGTATRLITVNPMDNASFTYGSSTYCKTGVNPTPTITGLAGGTFSSAPAGLVINTSTGLINLAASALGAYTVTYATNGTCPNTSSVTINITSAPSATFSYATPFCKNGANPSPTFPAGSSAGTFSSTAGLVFVNVNTGQINLTSSTPGTYTVTNSIAPSGGCAAATATFSITINPAPVVTATPASQTICSGTATSIALSSSLGSTTFNWTVTQSGVSGATAGSGPSIAQTLNTTAAAAGTATYTITSLSAGGCPGAPVTVTITVNPIPTVTPSPVAQTICSGNTTSISLTGNLPGTIFSWATPTQTGATGGTSGNISSIVQSLTATGSSAGTVTYNVVPLANSCPGSAVQVIITVKPSPNVTATPAASTICSGGTTSINLTSTTAGTSFTWTASNGAGISGASAGGGVTTISQVLTNSSTSTGTATYTVTPTAAGCPGTPITITVTVNPSPNVTASPTSQTICSGGSTSITLSGTVPSTTFGWATPTMVSATGGTSGGGFSINQSLFATGTSAGTVTYNVTPTANTCQGTPISVVVTVNPVPFVTATPATSTICSGATTAINLSSFTTGTTFSWTASNGTGISGASAGGPGASISQILNNSGTSTNAATYTVTPTANGCPGAPVTVTVNVNPVPNVVATPSSQSICSGTSTTISLSGSVAGTSFSWSAPSQTLASGGSSGNGNLISQPLTATSLSPGSVTYTITPKANSCNGTPISVTIDVNPNPTISATPASTTICSGTSTSIPLTSNISGTNFNWTVTSSGATGATAGSGYDISQTLTATGTTAGTVTYDITATTPAGCNSSVTTVTITVNPSPNVTATPTSATICSGATTAISISSAVTGTTYTWTVAQSNVSGATSGGGLSTIAQVLTATATTPGTAVYTITPSASGCASSSPVNVTITVNPLPVATATPSTQTICTGTATSINLTSNLSATTFDWTVSQTNLTGASANTGTSISQLLNLVTTTTTGSAVYSITPTDNGCPGTPITVTVNVNPIDNASFNYTSSTYCQTGTDPSANITGTAGGVFTSSPVGLVMDTASGLVDLSASTLGTYTITYQTNGPCPNNSAITLTITTAPSATFNYTASVCSSDPNPMPTFGAGSSAGVFSASPSGLVFVDNTTGEVDLALTTPGTYNITNTIAPAGGCAAASATGTITINQAATVGAGLNDSICELATITLTGIMGGNSSSVVWSTNGTGTFNDTTILGAVYTPSASDVTNGTVVLTVTTNDPAGSCPAVTDFMVLSITPLDNPAFSYTGSTFCQSGSDPIPTITGVMGGTFTASPSGVVINSTTGEIDLSTSTLGTYTVTYTTNGLCPNAATASVTITTAPSATFSFTSAATSFCQSGTNPTPVFASGASAGTFTANPSSGLVFVSTITGQIDLAGSTSGTYTIINNIVAAGGCAAAIDSLTITINQPAAVNAGIDNAVCAGGTYTAAGTSIGGSANSATWSTSGTGTFDNSSLLNATYTPSIADTTSGTVTLYLTTDDPAGVCNAVVDSMVLTITPLPHTPSVANPAPYCAGSTVGALTSSSTGGIINWYSDPALTTNVGTGNPFTPIGVTGTTSFWVTETIGSCVSPASQVTINFNPLPIVDSTTAIVTTANCGTSSGSITNVTVVSGQNPFTYVWKDVSGNIVGNSLNLTNVGQGVYTLTVTDGNGCVTHTGGGNAFTVASTNGVTASFTPTPTTGEKPLLVNFNNTSVGGINYLWQFGNGDTSTTTSPNYIFTKLGNFKVCLIADNGAGCSDTACTTIDVFINSVFVIPNIFTPNGDDVNDVFTVKNVGLKTMDAEIYNRWGQKEYEWHTTNGGWDGRTASGVLVPDGTYFFIISATGIDGKEYFEKGAFNLVR